MAPGRAPKIIVVDDDPHQRTILAEAVKLMGFEPKAASSAREALQLLTRESYDLIITDMSMPEIGGLELLARALAVDPGLSVIVVTANGTIETAVEAMKKGAQDYVLKPFEFASIHIVIDRVLKERTLIERNRKLESENATLRREIGLKYHLGPSLGTSTAAKLLLDHVRALATSRKHALLVGEAGTGKKELARMIHYNSPWAQSDFIHFDCAGIPEEFQEIYLFGDHALGRAGLIEKAHLGTILFSDLQRLNARCQTRMIRVLRDGATQRIGAPDLRKIDVRFIGTTTPDWVTGPDVYKHIRKDILETLAERVVELPALRDRKEDLPVLIVAAARRLAQATGKTIEQVDRSVIEHLQHHDFPGNYRELESMIESAVLRCQGKTLLAEHFAR